ncbi:hypothetical protein [Prosthecobacter sp.]|uniref:hypothetical protein n=1 Tax=Prosthecobacter sp. TaxID=1965333 RepID=UPI0037831F21
MQTENAGLLKNFGNPEEFHTIAIKPEHKESIEHNRASAYVPPIHHGGYDGSLLIQDTDSFFYRFLETTANRRQLSQTFRARFANSPPMA